MQPIPRLLANLLVILVKILVNLLVKPSRRQEEQSAMALAEEDAKRTGTVRPELSRSDYNLLLKEFESESPRTRGDALS